MMKKIANALVFIVLSLLTLGAVHASHGSGDFAALQEVQINGNTVTNEEVSIERGEEIEVEVKLHANTDAEDVSVEAEIKGFEFADEGELEDETAAFDMTANKTYFKKLKISLPHELEAGETYLLRLTVADKNHEAVKQNVNVFVEPVKHLVQIDDVDFNPGMTVKAGKALLVTVVLENFGEDTEENVKVTVSVPELGVSATDYVDELEEDDSKATEELFLKLPSDADAGTYEGTVQVWYHNKKKTVTQDFELTVLGAEGAAKAKEASKLVITVSPETQNVVAGGSMASFPVALANEGSTSKTFTFEATAGDWATTSLSESVVVLSPGETKVVFVNVAAKADAPAGEKTVSFAVKSDSKVLQTVALKANVVAQQPSQWASVRRGLEIALIVLVALLVIIGLVIGFSRLKKEDEVPPAEETGKKRREYY